MRLTFLLFMTCGSLCLAAAEKPAADAKEIKDKEKSAAVQEIEQPPVVREAMVKIDGKTFGYKVTTGKLLLKAADGKPRASVFHVTYERKDVSDPSGRPVMFCFNGGPGSSAVWLHLGGIGPRRVDLPGDGTQAPVPPARVVTNAHSILDVCDLVFVDPVSTGYSRPADEAKAGDFHGVDEDIESVGDFVRRWITEHDRWASPKYLLGESYGGVRVAGLSHHLQSRYGMSLNGVVLLSSLLDFRTIQNTAGNDLADIVFLPSYTGVAHFHGKIQGDRDALVRESTDFANGAYATALLQGWELEAEERDRVAGRLAELTGIESATWVKYGLRMNPSIYRGELLRAEGKVLGRFDARVAWDATDPAAQTPSYDPSYSLAFGAFSSAMLDYLGRDLGWKEHQPYEILTGNVQPWRWNAQNQIVNLSNRLAMAMRDNPHLRVLTMGGFTDLATPPEGVHHSIRHMQGLPEGARANFSHVDYDGGHMFYLNPPDLVKMRADLLEFIHPKASADGK
jgi:carboxypeptidase C (cathepsin A)